MPWDDGRQGETRDFLRRTSLLKNVSVTEAEMASALDCDAAKGLKLIAQTYVVRPVGIAAASRNEFRMLTHDLITH